MFIEIIGLGRKNAELIIANENYCAKRSGRASYLKSQFVSISHELRTPLYGVVGIYNKICYWMSMKLADSPHLASLNFLRVTYHLLMMFFKLIG
jgi:signal transduction histidine kinase